MEIDLCNLIPKPKARALTIFGVVSEKATRYLAEANMYAQMNNSNPLEPRVKSPRRYTFKWWRRFFVCITNRWWNVFSTMTERERFYAINNGCCNSLQLRHSTEAQSHRVRSNILIQLCSGINHCGLNSNNAIVMDIWSEITIDTDSFNCFNFQLDVRF